MMKIMNFYFKLSRERTKFIHEETLYTNKILYFKRSVNNTMYLLKKIHSLTFSAAVFPNNKNLMPDIFISYYLRHCCFHKWNLLT